MIVWPDTVVPPTLSFAINSPSVTAPAESMLIVPLYRLRPPVTFTEFASTEKSPYAITDPLTSNSLMLSNVNDAVFIASPIFIPPVPIPSVPTSTLNFSGFVSDVLNPKFTPFNTCNIDPIEISPVEITVNGLLALFRTYKLLTAPFGVASFVPGFKSNPTIMLFVTSNPGATSTPPVV